MKNEKHWRFTVGALALLLVTQFAVYRSEPRPQTASSHVAWQLAPRDMNEVFGASQSVVLGKVVSISAGPELSVPVQGEPGGMDRVPTERIVLALDDNADKGSAKKGNQLVIFRTGGQTDLPQTGQRGQPDEAKNRGEHLSAPAGGKPSDPSKAPTAPAPPPAPTGAAAKPAGARRLMTFEGDPPYKKGQQYYLALTAGPSGTLRTVHPAGRYLVKGDGSVQAVGDDPVSLNSNGKKLADLRSAAKGAKKLEMDPNLAAQIAAEPESAHTAEIYTGADEAPEEYDAPEAVAEINAAAEADTNAILQEIAPAVAAVDANIAAEAAAQDAQVAAEEAAAAQAAADALSETTAAEAPKTEQEGAPAEPSASETGLSGALAGQNGVLILVGLLVIVAGFFFMRRKS